MIQFGGIAQLARALGSYPGCRWFKSTCRYHLRPVGQEVKTSPFHGGIMGSIPVRVTIEVAHKWLNEAIYELFIFHIKPFCSLFVLYLRESLSSAVFRILPKYKKLLIITTAYNSILTHFRVTYNDIFLLREQIENRCTSCTKVYDPVCRAGLREQLGVPFAVPAMYL